MMGENEQLLESTTALGQTQQRPQSSPRRFTKPRQHGAVADHTRSQKRSARAAVAPLRRLQTLFELHI